MLINEHDKAKEMIATVRGLLTEQPADINEPTIDDTEEQEEIPKDTSIDIVTIEGADLEEEIQKYKDAVSKRVSDRDFEPLKIYKSSGNVVWGGKIPEFGLEWVFDLRNNNEVAIISDYTVLDDDSIKVLKLLMVYYETWSTEWYDRVDTEYSGEPDVEDEGGEEPEELS
jgi:hypothetical protein